MTGFLAFVVTMVCMAGAVVIARSALRQSSWVRTVLTSLGLVVWLGVFLVPLLIFDGPYVAFEAASLRCGGEPVIARHILEEGYYVEPGAPGYGVEINIWGGTEYYCTAAEAQAHGFTKR